MKKYFIFINIFFQAFHLIIISLLIINISLIISSCSTNPLTKFAPQDLEAEAQNDMENKNYNSAQEKLKEILDNEPDNYNARALYATSFAAQADVILLDLIFKVQESSDSAASPMSLAFEIAPSPTPENIAFMKKAVDEMELIPKDQRDKGKSLLYDIYFSLYNFLLLKKLKEDLKNLSTLDPNTVLLLINSLSTYLLNAGADSPLSGSAGEILDNINNAPGETQTEKVKEYLDKYDENGNPRNP